MIHQNNRVLRWCLTSLQTVVAVSSFWAAEVLAAEDLFRLNPDKVAICEDNHSKVGDCYDPVSYFQGKPKVGKKEIAAEHEGAKYLFSTEENKKLFLSSPTKYLPAYNGWCAYGVANDKKITVDPLQYTLTGGRLHLFYKNFLINTKTKWEKDEVKLSGLAEQKWSQVSKQKEE